MVDIFISLMRAIIHITIAYLVMYYVFGYTLTKRK